jgi:hypothetical protein
MPGLGDHEGWSRANDLDRFTEDPLDVSWVAVDSGEVDCPPSRLNVLQIDNAPFDLGDGLLCNHDDIGVAQAAVGGGRIVQQDSEVVAVGELG